jgi:hypothetical protein
MGGWLAFALTACKHCTEMEFLDIILTKDWSLLLHAIHSPFYWRISKKGILYSGFRNPYKKIAKQETQKNEGRKPDKNSSLKRLNFMPGNHGQNVVKEFHLSTQ